MAQAKGFKSRLVMDFETAFGMDPESPSGLIMPIKTSSIRATRNLIEDTTIRDNRNPAQPAKGNLAVGGTVVVPVDLRAFGWWLKAMFGAPITTGAGPYTHVFKVGDGQPSLVLEQGYTDIGKYEKFNGCKISSMSMSMGGDGELSASIEIMGAKSLKGDAPYDDTPAAISLSKFNQFQLTAKEGGANIATLTSVDLTINNNLDGNQYLIGGQGTRGDIPEGLIQISGNVKGLFTDFALYTKASAGTESSLQFKFINGAYSLQIDMSEIMYEENSPAIEGPTGILMDLNYRAYFDDHADGSAIVVTLVNDIPSYA